MKEYITLFDTHSDYETYINGQNKTLPNVSYCIDNNDVHYNPQLSYIVAKFNILDTSTETKICNLPEEINVIEIDGVQLSEPISTYQFNTTGEHTVKYVTKSKDSIVNELFSTCDGSDKTIRNGMISIEIPSKYINIGSNAFHNVNTLEKIVFNTPDQIRIGSYLVNYGNYTNILQIIIKSQYIAKSVGSAIGIIQLGNIPGFIYVPDDLVDQYKRHADWGFVSSKIKGLSELS